MSHDPITIYKLVILYTLSKVETPLPPAIISDYIIERGYTNYFTLQNAFGELLEADLICEETTYHLTYYKLADAGRETLSHFGASLSPQIRREIDDYLLERKYDVVDGSSLVSDYRLTADGTYLVTCLIREGSQVAFRLEINVISEADAMKMCENWDSECGSLYQNAMQSLLRQAEER